MASRGVPHRDVPGCYGSAPCAGCMWRDECEGLRERPRKPTDALAAKRRRAYMSAYHVKRRERAATGGADEKECK